jgi:hypothetical protein
MIADTLFRQEQIGRDQSKFTQSRGETENMEGKEISDPSCRSQEPCEMHGHLQGCQVAVRDVRLWQIECA